MLLPSSIAVAGKTEILPRSAVEPELALLQALQSLLDVAMGSLSRGEALPLLEVSRQLTLAAQQFTAISPQLISLAGAAETQRQKRRLLGELRQQCAFCHAMLRRWRRSIVLRQQLLGLRDEPLPYTESLTIDPLPKAWS